ncbi:MAG: L-ribulose-5-phosphate 4-epimerase [Tissierellia bacterium]|nr:L-ribulose-5-phosphate 4-epimerase [Tissierellia bacterium]
MLEDLKKKVLQANLQLPKNNLVKFTWGNVSAVDRDKKLFVIKASGVDYDKLTPEMMVVCDFDGRVVEGDYRPSSDTKTHAVLYKTYPQIGAVVHTHQEWATSWAQAGVDIPILGTTHADVFNGDIPCGSYLSPDEIKEDYEKNTGHVIVETLNSKKIDPLEVPAIILHGHGPFIWGKSLDDAIEHAVVLEEVCKMNYRAININPKLEKLPKYILDKHYQRKHGSDAYYGQGGKDE